MNMKKILLLAVAFTLSMGSAMAQNAKFETMRTSHQLVERNSAQPSAMKRQPKKVELGENQLIMGPYTSDALCQDGYGMGVPSVPGQTKVATYLPAEMIEQFNGSNVVKIRYGLDSAADNVSVFLLGITSKGIDELVNVPAKSSAKGWNEVTLPTPYTLNTDGYEALLLGYEYNQTANGYPISMVNEGTLLESYLYSNLGNGEGWYTLGTSYGNLSVQAIVENENFPKVNIVIDGLAVSSKYFQTGEEMTYALQLHNFGTGTAESYKVNIDVDGNLMAQVEGTDAASLQPKAFSGSFTLPADLTMGTHTVTATLVEVDGEEVAGQQPVTASTSFFVYFESVPRQKNMIEQYTSQNCTYCPRGVTLFSDIIAMRDDIAWVSVHGYMSGNDSFTTDESNAIVNYVGVTGYPSASYNRSFVPELAEGTEIAYGLGYNMSYRTQIVALLNEVIDYTAEAPSFVTLGIEQQFDPDTRQLNVTVNGQGASRASEMLDGYGLTVYVTENGVVARQLNEGRWVNNFEHHFAFRKALSSIYGDAIQWDGDKFTQQYSYVIPESYVAENMQIVAFVAPVIDATNPDPSNMTINNCETANVEVSSGIGFQSLDATVAASYNLNGVELAAPQRGVNIVRMANGQVKKVVVK